MVLVGPEGSPMLGLGRITPRQQGPEQQQGTEHPPGW